MTTEPITDNRLPNLIFYAVVILVGYLVFLVFRPFLGPLAWAAVLAVVFYPMHERLANRWGNTGAAAASTLLITLILIVPAGLVAAAFVRQAFQAAQAVHNAVSGGHIPALSRGWAWVQGHFPELSADDIAQRVQATGEKVAGAAAASMGLVLSHVARFLFDLFVTIFSLFYLLRDGDGLVKTLRVFLPFEESHRERMIREGRDLIFASVTSTLVAACIHGVMGGLAFAIGGITAPVFWGVMMAFASLIPLVGSSIVWVPGAIWLMTHGHVGRGIFVIAVGVTVVMVVDYVVRPWLIGERSELSGLMIFISVVGGIGVFGMLGIILGPIVLATAVTIFDIYSERQPDGRKIARPRLVKRRRVTV
jgi:predicted PurR-regulated permease PerM